VWYGCILGGEPATVPDVFKGIVHEPALAPTIVRGVVVDQLLLRQGDQVAYPDDVDAIHRHHSGEGLAAAALPLVLHAGDRSLLPPVYELRQVRHIHVGVYEAQDGRGDRAITGGVL
jgi:hypothetical protein